MKNKGIVLNRKCTGERF